MRKTSKTARITILLLVLCLISTAMLSGTFAKYTSEYAGADTALIAKWEIEFDDDNTTTSGTTLDLFSHAFDTNINAKEGEDYIIAPGVSGDFTLKVENKGDVAAKMTFDFDDSGTAGTVPIEYSIDEENWYSIDEIEGVLNGLPEMQNVAAGTGTAEQIVEWRWPFERGSDHNEADTYLGTNSAAGTGEGAGGRTEYILTIKATATQITPKTTSL